MTLQDLSHWSTFLAALFTAVSALFAVYSYTRNTKRETLKQVRKNITSFRVKFSQIDQLLDASCNVELSDNISKELHSLFSEQPSRDEFINFITDEKSEPYILQAFYLGISKATVLKRTTEITQELRVLSSIDRELFPLTSTTLSLLLIYPETALLTLKDPEPLVNLFENPEAIEELQSNQSIAANEKLIFTEVATWITHLSSSLSENMSDNVTGYVEEIVDIICSIFESSSDKDLNKLSNCEQKYRKEYLEKAAEMSAVESLFVLLKFYREYVSTRDWDKLVECKTRLEMLHENNENEI